MLSGPEKVAILVSYLDKVKAKKIVESLSETEKKALKVAQKTLHNIDENVKKKVIENFINQVNKMDS